MRIIKSIIALLVACLILMGVEFAHILTFSEDSSDIVNENEYVFGDGSFSYTGSKVNEISVADGCEMTVLTPEMAENQGVPSGYSGNILKTSSLSSSDKFDMVFDFTNANLKLKSIEEMFFKVYIVSTPFDDEKHPELRSPVPGTTTSWIFGGGIAANETDQWITVAMNESQIAKFCPDGYLKKFCLCLRTNAKTTMYIDEIGIKVRDLETIPPEINCNIDIIKTTEFSYPCIVDATDNSGTCKVEYIWSDGALDNFGRLTCGTHICTIKATDDCDNETSKILTYIVEAEPLTVYYSIKFIIDGEVFETLIYCNDEIDYLVIPTVPDKNGKSGKWEDFTFEKIENQIVNAVYK